MESKIGNLLSYGFKREPKIRRFLFSLILSSLYFILIGIPLLLGYMFRIADSRSRDENIQQPPKFRPLLPLFKNGMVVVLYAVTMIGIPSLIIAGINYGVGEFIQTSDQIQLTTAVAINATLATMLAVLILNTILFLPMIGRYSKVGSWKSGYKITKLFSMIYSKEYIFTYLKFMTMSVLAGYITSFLIQSFIFAPIGAILWYVYISGIGVILGDFIRHDSKAQKQREDIEE